MFGQHKLTFIMRSIWFTFGSPSAPCQCKRLHHNALACSYWFKQRKSTAVGCLRSDLARLSLPRKVTGFLFAAASLSCSVAAFFATTWHDKRGLCCTDSSHHLCCYNLKNKLIIFVGNGYFRNFAFMKKENQETTVCGESYNYSSRKASDYRMWPSCMA